MRSVPFFVPRKALTRLVRQTTFNRRNLLETRAPQTAMQLLPPPTWEASDELFEAESSCDCFRVHGRDGRVWQRVFLADATDVAIAGSCDWHYSSLDSHECADARGERVQPKRSYPVFYAPCKFRDLMIYRRLIFRCHKI